MRDLDLKEFIATILDGRRLLMCVSVISALIGVWIAWSSPNVYSADAIVAVRGPSTSLAGAINRSSLDILGLGAVTQTRLSPTDVAVAMEKLKSRDFLVKFARDRKLVPQLLAVEHWDPGSGSLLYDNKLYNSDTGDWMQWGGVALREPSDNDIFLNLFARIKITNTENIGIFKITIEHESPILAALWVGWVIEDLNNLVRTEQADLAGALAQGLNNELLEVSEVSVRNALSQVIENKTIEKLLIGAERNYVFKVIDPPIVPKSRSRPKKLLIVSRWVSFGLLVSLFILFSKALFLNNQSNKKIE